MNISFGYSYIFQMILTSVFFEALFPLGSIIGLIGIILYYIIDKVKNLKIFMKFKLFELYLFTKIDLQLYIKYKVSFGKKI